MEKVKFSDIEIGKFFIYRKIVLKKIDNENGRTAHGEKFYIHEDEEVTTKIGDSYEN